MPTTQQGLVTLRATELHEKACMPWEDAVELAMSEQGISLPLYLAVNKLVCQIGYEGSIDSSHALVAEVMDALHDLDGGAHISIAPQPPAGQQDRGGALTQHQIAVRLHDFPALSAFHSKHATGALAAPSCLCCGKSTQGLEIGVQHLELPGIVICKSCKDRATSSEATGNAETYLRGKYGAYRGHFAWRELEEAFNAGVAAAESRVSAPGAVEGKKT